MFVALLKISRSLASISVSLNDEPWVIKPVLIDLNSVELTYYPVIDLLI